MHFKISFFIKLPIRVENSNVIFIIRKINLFLTFFYFSLIIGVAKNISDESSSVAEKAASFIVAASHVNFGDEPVIIFLKIF